MANKLIWLSYDLGVEGDYEGIYTWLAAHGAKECGDSVAVFFYKFTRDLVTELATDLRTSVKINRRTRFYIVFQTPPGKMKGKFIVGGRRRPPWEDFVTDAQGDDDE